MSCLKKSKFAIQKTKFYMLKLTFGLSLWGLFNQKMTKGTDNCYFGFNIKYVIKVVSNNACLILFIYQIILSETFLTDIQIISFSEMLCEI